jgi:uncharacterized membrane protein YbhN (UPF0104 family)
MRHLLLAGKCALSVLLLWLVFRSVPLDAVVTQIRLAHRGDLLLAFAIIGLQFAVAAIRWQIVSRKIIGGLSYPFIFRLFMIGQFFSQLLPSSVGGDATRIWMLYRAGFSMQDASHSVLVDRVAGLLALLLLVTASFPFLSTIIPDPARVTLEAIAGAGFCGLAVVIMLAWLVGKRLEHNRAARILRALAISAGRILLDKDFGPQILLLSVAIHALTILAIAILAHALSLPIGVWELALLVPVTQLVALVPISISGWGVREGLMVTVLGFVGVPPQGALMLSMLFGLTLLLASAPGGLYWLRHRRSSSAVPLEG